MDIDTLKGKDWLEPWYYVGAGGADQLAKETPEGHALYKVRAISIGEHRSEDDMLFYLPEHDKPLAVVHLTYNTKQSGPEFPFTEFYDSWEDFVERRMRPEHEFFKDE